MPDNRTKSLNEKRTQMEHLNDVENIFSFIFTSALYLITVRPSSFVAKSLFIAFTSSRFIHTFVYVYEVRTFLYFYNEFWG